MLAVYRREELADGTIELRFDRFALTMEAAVKRANDLEADGVSVHIYAEDMRRALYRTPSTR